MLTLWHSSRYLLCYLMLSLIRCAIHLSYTSPIVFCPLLPLCCTRMKLLSARTRNANGAWIFIQITEIKNLWDSESLPLWTSSPTKTKENNTFPGTSFFPSTMFMGPSRTPHKEEGGQWEIDFLTAVFLFRGRRSSKTDCRWGELPGLCFCISIKEFWGPLKSIRRWGNKDRRSARSHG